MRPHPSILWRRLDLEGHDACLLCEADDGWKLRGHALFVHDGKPCSLAYEADCDSGWRTRSARVDGFLGAETLHFEIERLADGGWTLNGAGQAEVAGLIDVDLGFTPATNLLAIRRFDLGVGMSTPAPAAYLGFPELRLMRLEQSYRRLDDTRYGYDAPMFGYNAILEVSPAGFVLDYPGLWRSAARLE
ncbi:putative glycolipid-binding domain-containing protein [Mesorhizobium abyssinicae]|uniref:Glycolipid-binding domain-containing protein n=1 Tax=Mesorhizobium abyssinicae TaxID=1209958 RepID=A0ABU5ALC2_9HYPH|nr:putative glycolipid-binding domain-containing protein [Mesorhizobium abyssinicae]MDX8538056.1 putative glycolipid-binding domain-containing protein [Mesorhizobium abyssinicae]